VNPFHHFRNDPCAHPFFEAIERPFSLGLLMFFKFHLFPKHWGKAKKEKKNIFWYPAQQNPQPGMVGATPWANFAIIGVQLCSTTVAIFPCVALSYKNCSLFRIIADHCRPQQRPTIWIWVQLLWAFAHFEPQYRFCVPKNCTILVWLHSCLLSPHPPFFGGWWGTGMSFSQLTYMEDMTRLYVGYGSLIWLVYMWDMAHLCEPYPTYKRVISSI